MSPHFLKNGCGIEGEKAFFAEEWQLIEKEQGIHIFAKKYPSDYSVIIMKGHMMDTTLDKWSNIKLSTPGTHSFYAFLGILY